LYRVLACVTQQHDLRLVLLAAAVCAATAVTSFGIYSRIEHSRPSMRLLWLLMTGLCAASGIWATHFVAMLAFDAGIPTAYDPALTAASLFIAIIATTLGFAVATGASRVAAVAGGTILGLGISMMHFTGMRALLVAGHIQWDYTLVGFAIVLGALLGAAATTAFHALTGKRAIAAGAVILTLAICAMHFTAMGAASIEPDPTVNVPWGFSADASMMALAIAGLTFLVIFAGLAAALIDHRTTQDNIGHVRELVDAASEGIVISEDGRIVNVNRRVSELCGRTIEDLAGKSVADELLLDLRFDDSDSDADCQAAEASIVALGGKLIPVEVIRRPFRSGVRGNEVYAIRDLTERHRHEAKIAHMARHDALTDLPNRVLLRERLEPALRSGRRGEKVAVICLDLDRFKAVNDTLGHPIGDALLKQVAKRLLGCVREGDTVARIGGDEFVILQSSSEPWKAAADLAARVIDEISAPYDVNGHHVNIGTSVGIAVPLTDDVTAETLLAQADMALYSSKGSGRGAYTFFEQEMNTRAHARREFERDLRSALANGELELNYQPFVDLRRYEISGVEALLRWHHPQLGLVLPASFIPIAEETGLIGEIGAWVLQEACAEAARWPEHVKIAVNLSPVQFKSPKLVECVSRAITAAGLAAERLELEITESVLLQDSEKTLDILQGLRDLGARISMDDFGTGYSSLSYLQKFSFDKIKIDRCFVSNAAEGGGGLAVIRAISGLGRAMGLVVTAEGVETQEQVELVRKERCTEVQGYFFGRPVAARDIRAMLLGGAGKAVAAGAAA
jgi:diguanylate cyclase (GGDEF)-like protein/PAS domain S-box-containing protein